MWWIRLRAWAARPARVPRIWLCLLLGLALVGGVLALGVDVAVRFPLLRRVAGLVVLGGLALASVTDLVTRVRRRRGTGGAGARGRGADRADERETVDALERSQAYFANIVQLSEDAIISVDRDQRITLFNVGAERTFGYRTSEVIGQPLDVLLPSRLRAVHREHVERFAAAPDAVRPMRERGVLVGRRKDGTEFPLEATISKFEIRGERVLTVRLRDIADRRRAEEALQQLAAIVHSSDDAIIGKAVDGTIVSWNAGAERLYGYAAGETVGRQITFLVPPDRLDEFHRMEARVRDGEHVGQVETVRIRKDGTRCAVSVSLSPILDGAGRLVGVSAIARDITERKRMEAQLRQAQKMEALGTLAGGIAHDFNNILNAMTGNAELLTDRLPRGSRAREHLQEILTAGNRAKELVRQILTFSRRSETERRPVAVQDILAEALRLLRATIPTTVEFRAQVEPGRAMVLADPTQLHQVLVNLGTNAEHAMRARGGLLEVLVRTVEVDGEFATAHPPLQPGSHVRISVRDTGHGMTSEVQERLFEPFFTTKRPGEGTGMGLAVVHGIVTAHGGTITVESAPARGTRFDVYLPRCDIAERPDIPLEEPARGHGEHILLVDDEVPLTRVWTAMLEQLGYRVTAFNDSGQALEALRRTPATFDLVITDQTMPGLTGIALSREVLQLRPQLPIILCTGYSHTLTEDKVKALGIRALLLKPVGRRDLCLAVQQLLADRAAHLP